MGRSLVVAALALVGLLCAAGMGYARLRRLARLGRRAGDEAQQVPQELTPGPREARARLRTPGPVETTHDHDTHRRTAASDDDRRRPRRPHGSGEQRPRRRRPRRRRLELLFELRERGPARVGLGLAVVVRLVVQVLAADRAEAGAVGLAEDLVRQLERDRVARPGREVELVVLEVDRAQLLVVARARRPGTRAPRRARRARRPRGSGSTGRAAARRSAARRPSRSRRA